MHTYTNGLKGQLEQQLTAIRDNAPDMCAQCGGAIPLIRKSILELRVYMQGYKFSDKDDEIAFHKNIAPGFNAEYIFHIRVLNIETKMPANEPYSRKKYILEEIKKINKFFNQDKGLYQYFKMGLCSFDDKFFLRTGQSELECEEYCAVMDMQFCTLHSFKFAQFRGYERVLDYLAGCLQRIDGDHVQNKKEAGEQGNISWTAKKVFAHELVYAIFYAKCVNNGNISLRELFERFEAFFNVRLGNIYQAKQEIYMRRNSSFFIDFLRKCFVEGMEETDERGRK